MSPVLGGGREARVEPAALEQGQTSIEEHIEYGPEGHGLKVTRL